MNRRSFVGRALAGLAAVLGIAPRVKAAEELPVPVEYRRAAGIRWAPWKRFHFPTAAGTMRRLRQRLFHTKGQR